MSTRNPLPLEIARTVNLEDVENDVLSGWVHAVVIRQPVVNAVELMYEEARFPETSATALLEAIYDWPTDIARRIARWLGRHESDPESGVSLLRDVPYQGHQTTIIILQV